ncbi:uncharacterized protein [Henckelia pumila]|uniref:uncharacterized protein isoform X3 n=1 Tax=Henckelia pumila TaxID=405737 RepID=UPI003C6E3C86
MAPRGRKQSRNLLSLEADRPRKTPNLQMPPTKEKAEMVEDENCIEENERNGSIGKDVMSRCSSTYFRKVMKKLELKLSEKQLDRIKSTPFCKWLKMPKLSIYRNRVDVVLKRFDSYSSSFIFGKDIIVPFTSFEFSLVLGLPYAGPQVDLDLRTQSKFLSRYFSGKLCNATRKKISENLLLLAELNDDLQLDDFIRMFILFSFNCIVFPLSTYMTPRFVFCYIDDLSNFFEYSWGDAAYRFLCDKIAAHIVEPDGTVAGTTYLDGCVVGMMAWFYEKVPSLGVLSGSLRTFPRLFKWSESKIPLNAEAADALLKKITRTKVLNITPFGEELEIFGEGHRNERVSSKMKEEETAWRIQRLEKTLEDQLREIQRLKELCQTSRIISKEIGASLDDGEAVEKKNDDKNVPIVDELKDFDKYEGGYDESWNINVVADFKGDGASFSELNVENKIIEDVHLREVVDERNSESDIAGSVEENVSNLISSIVKNVMTRTDRVKKRKPDMFVTPPSSTPRHKTKSIMRDKDFTIISDEESKGTNESGYEDESALDIYKGREDFCGSIEVSSDDRKIIMDYLTHEKICGTVWEGERFPIFGDQLCHLLFGKKVRGDIINCYMQIVSGYSRKNGFDILCMDTTLQDSRKQLEEVNKNSMDRCRFLLFPMNRNDHWFLLIYKTETREFELRNSIHTPQALGTARSYCYARDDDEKWIYEKDCTMNSVRARIAATILSDKNGLFGKVS